MTPIERIKLLAALRNARSALQSAPNPLARLKIVKEIREIRVKLGAATAPTTPAEPAAPDTSGFMQVLRDIAQGKRDNAGLDALYGFIHSAVHGLNDLQMLVGEAVEVANAAITRWGELDLKIHG